MARPFKICPDCGAHLDASEPCDCKDAIEREPPKPRERLKLLAVCREVDKESGRSSTRNCATSRPRRHVGTATAKSWRVS